MVIEIMPWGKHKNQRIDRLPSDYLRWLAENIADEAKGENSVCLAADREYRDREKYGSHMDEVAEENTKNVAYKV